jgi:hypothetical protein
MGSDLRMVLRSSGSPMTDWVTSHKYLWEVRPKANFLIMNVECIHVQYILNKYLLLIIAIE